MTKQRLERIERALRRTEAEPVTVTLALTFVDADGRMWVELPDGRVMDEAAYLEEAKRSGARVIALKWDDEQGEG